MKLQNPAPGRRVTSPFGMRKHPTLGTWRMHNGIDYGGTFDVLAAGDGIVVHVADEWNNLTPKQKARQTGGNVVTIKHADNLFTTYYHGQRQTHLKVGDRVKAGDKIYVSGSTGRSTGPHLHFETRTTRTGGQRDPNIYLNGASVTPVNPGGAPNTNKLDRATWKAWQEALKKHHGYTGMIDGIPGKLSWAAVQRSAKQHYKGPIDGIPGPNTYKAVQSKLKALGYYDGIVDGIWGKATISGLQRALNEGGYK